jgi:adenine-specific DNA-methyltransferase
MMVEINMTTTKQKLELTWIGKDKRPRLEPRIFLEDKSLSYQSAKVITNEEGEANPAFNDNLLIHGDNLLALKALEHQYAGKVKCVFIDPPYNTGSAFTQYDDGLEHSMWLSMIKHRLDIIYNLIGEDGTIWISIDDTI